MGTRSGKMSCRMVSLKLILFKTDFQQISEQQILSHRQDS
jgi:hypothetical protein